MLPSESYRHFMAKAAMYYLLRKMRHELETEWRVGNGIVDILDRTTMTFYEIEFSNSPKRRNRKIAQYRTPGCEVIVVDCSKLPKELYPMKRYLDQYVVPD